MKSKTKQIINTVLFIGSVVGVVGTAAMSAYDTYKAIKKIEEMDIDTSNKKEVVKQTATCYIRTGVVAVATVACGIASKKMDGNTIAGLSAAVAAGGGLVTKYREKIRDISGDDILKQIDKEVAAEEIVKAKPPVINTPGIITNGESFDLANDGECLFFDPFTHMKFRSSKLSVLGAKYFLNRNYAIGGNVGLEMFYNFMGVELPEEYRACEWDMEVLADGGYVWIDIDLMRADTPDPETGEPYYIIQYELYPSDDVEESFYPFGNPIDTEGSYAV